MAISKNQYFVINLNLIKKLLIYNHKLHFIKFTKWYIKQNCIIHIFILTLSYLRTYKSQNAVLFQFINLIHLTSDKSYIGIISTDNWIK